MAPFRVKVSIVEPAAFKTEMWSKTAEIKFTRDGSPYEKGLTALHQWAACDAENSADPVEVVKLICDIVV